MHALKRVTKCAEIVFVSIFKSSFNISSDSDTFFTLSLHIAALTSSFCISEENDNWSEYANSMMSHMSVYEEKKKNFLFKVSTFFYCMMTVLMTSIRFSICSVSLSFMLFNYTHFVSFYIVIEKNNHATAIWQTEDNTCKSPAVSTHRSIEWSVTSLRWRAFCQRCNAAVIADHSLNIDLTIINVMKLQ